MPFKIPESYLAYCTDRAVKLAVEHILEYETPGVPADLEWNDLPEFHRAVLSAHQVRCEFARNAEMAGSLTESTGGWPAARRCVLQPDRSSSAEW